MFDDGCCCDYRHRHRHSLWMSPAPMMMLQVPGAVFVSDREVQSLQNGCSVVVLPPQNWAIQSRQAQLPSALCHPKPDQEQRRSAPPLHPKQSGHYFCGPLHLCRSPHLAQSAWKVLLGPLSAAAAAAVLWRLRLCCWSTWLDVRKARLSLDF